jgi:hypothetical protein
MNEPVKVELVFYTNCILLDGLTQQVRAVRTAFPRIESYPFQPSNLYPIAAAGDKRGFPPRTTTS